MKITIVLWIIIPFFLAAGVARAGTLVVDPDSFPNGTDISNAFPGVTLTSVFGEPSSPSSTGPVYAVADGQAATAPNVFAFSTSNTTWGNGTFEFLRADFTVDVTSCSLAFIANDNSDSNAELVAYDALDTEIDRAQFLGAMANGISQTLTVTSPQISYIVAYWDEISRSDNGILDHLECITPEAAAVAIPATTSLVTFLLAGFLAVLGASSFARKGGRFGCDSK